MASMSRMHFRALAEAVRGLPPGASRAVVAEALADVCRRFNGGFDRGRFLRAALEEREAEAVYLRLDDALDDDTNNSRRP